LVGTAESKALPVRGTGLWLVRKMGVAGRDAGNTLQCESNVQLGRGLRHVRMPMTDIGTGTYPS